MKIVFILLSLLAMYYGCSKTEIDISRFPGAESEYTISIHDTISLSLNSNPTTGYSWNWANKDLVKIVTSSGSQFMQDTPADKKVVGRGGKEIWKFLGVQRGIDTIKMVYRRPWDATSGIDTLRILVKVK